MWLLHIIYYSGFKDYEIFIFFTFMISQIYIVVWDQGSNALLQLPVWCLHFSSIGKESACNVGDLGSIPGLGGSPGEGEGYPLQYSSLENSKDCIVHGWQRIGHDWVTFTVHFCLHVVVTRTSQPVQNTTLGAPPPRTWGPPAPVGPALTDRGICL